MKIEFINVGFVAGNEYLIDYEQFSLDYCVYYTHLNLYWLSRNEFIQFTKQNNEIIFQFILPIYYKKFFVFFVCLEFLRECEKMQKKKWWNSIFVGFINIFIYSFLN